MVQLPELCDEKSEAFKAGYKTIAEISKERIRRAGKKIREKNTLTAQKLDIGFRALKVDSSNMADVYYAPDRTKQDELFKNTDNLKGDRTSEDLLFQVLLDWGVDLTLPITPETIADREVFFVDKNALAACFEKNGIITNDRDILNHAGKISHEIAKQLAEGEYEKFHTRRLSTSKNELSDFDRAVQQIESQKKGEKHD